MARRRTRYRTRTRTVYKKARGFGGGHKDVIDGAIVGLVQGFVPDDALMGLADPLIALGVGYFRRNSTLKTLGGYQLGLKLPAMVGSKQNGTFGVSSQVG